MVQNKMKMILPALLLGLTLTACKDTRMPNNRVVSNSQSVSDVMAERTAENTEEASLNKTEETGETESAEEARDPYETVDVDLTQSSETMLYSQVIQLGDDLESYKGNVIRVQGQYMYYHDDSSEYSFPSVIVMDATKCCATGLVFDSAFDVSKLNEGDAIMVTGILDDFSSADSPFPTLKEAFVTVQ